MCTDINGNCRKLVLLMMIVSDSGSYAEAFVNELFVQVVCGNTIIAIFTNSLRLRYVNYIQTAFVWIKRGLSLSRYCDEGEKNDDDGFLAHCFAIFIRLHIPSR